jgi:hypothetical protein
VEKCLRWCLGGGGGNHGRAMAGAQAIAAPLSVPAPLVDGYDSAPTPKKLRPQLHLVDFFSPLKLPHALTMRRFHSTDLPVAPFVLVQLYVQARESTMYVIIPVVWCKGTNIFALVVRGKEYFACTTMHIFSRIHY